MSRQAFELLDLESGYKYTLETSTDILPSDFNLVLPDRNGTLALTKDVDDLSGKLIRGDVVVGDSKKLDGKSLSEIALSDMSNVTLTPEMINSLRGYTGSAGSAGPIGLQGGTGYTGSTGYVGSAGIDGTQGYTGSKGADGIAGGIGPIGPQGYTGSAGVNGNNGYTGSAGVNGYTGSKGADGTNGYNGSTGYTGSKGADGGSLEPVVDAFFNGTNITLDLSRSSTFVAIINPGDVLTIKPINATNYVYDELTMMNLHTALYYVLEVIDGGQGVISWTSTDGAPVRWSNGIAPVLTSSGKDILGFISVNGGTHWDGVVLSKDTK